MRFFSVAIDGPAGSGKSTVARHVAKYLDYLYVDSGAMYRAVAWRALQEHIDLEQSEAVATLAKRLRFKLSKRGIVVDGEHLTHQLRTPEVSKGASLIAKNVAVRETLVQKQQEFAACYHVVMDGRDIGTRVLPHADVKIFLTASIAERAKRRFLELQKKGYKGDLKSLEQEMQQRDHDDSTREISPLQKAADAELLDTTHLSIEKIVDQILSICGTKIGGGE